MLGLEVLQLAVPRVPSLIMPTTLRLGVCSPRSRASFGHREDVEVGRARSLWASVQRRPGRLEKCL